MKPQFTEPHDYPFVSDPDARAMLGILGEISHELDDLCDGDREPTPENLLGLMSCALCELPSNPFYQQYHARLHPLIRHALMGYIASYRVENHEASEGTSRRAVAFTLRDLLAMVALECVAITDGHTAAFNQADQVWMEYTSTDDDWREWIGGAAPTEEDTYESTMTNALPVPSGLNLGDDTGHCYHSGASIKIGDHIDIDLARDIVKGTVIRYFDGLGYRELGPGRIGNTAAISRLNLPEVTFIRRHDAPEADNYQLTSRTQTHGCETGSVYTSGGGSVCVGDDAYYHDSGGRRVFGEILVNQHYLMNFRIANSNGRIPITNKFLPRLHPLEREAINA